MNQQSVFKDYARYYDLLYRDKNYPLEAEYIYGLLKKNNTLLGDILELGCGTGVHAELLAQKGYHVHGIDLSDDMLSIAQKRTSNLAPDVQKRLEFTHGDITTTRLDKTFDAVLSLFHVVSYQTTNPALEATLATAKKHLKPGGVLIFDFWYGPAVLTARPEKREKILEDDHLKITRRANPILHANTNVVDVQYQVTIQNKVTNQTTELRESHKMRYFFYPEFDFILKRSGFKILKSEEWLTGREPGFDTWGVCFVCKEFV